MLVTWLVLDASASMSFGTGERRKADVAEGVAIAVGYAATRRGNRLGTVAFGAEPVVERPRQGRRALLDTLRLLRDLPPAGTGTLREALELADRVTKQRALVVVVSDFRGPIDWRPPLLRLAGRHAVLAVEVRDPREQELADVGSCGSSIRRPDGSCASIPATEGFGSVSPRSPQTNAARSSHRWRRRAYDMSRCRPRAIGCRPLAAFLRRGRHAR